MDAVKFSDLIGYESQKEELRKNTEAFLRGQRANNVLLYGDSGTGKSTSIKAVVNEYYKDGLRMIEIYKYQSDGSPKYSRKSKIEITASSSTWTISPLRKTSPSINS